MKITGMLRVAPALVLCATAEAAAVAQATVNAVTSADDAFGFTIGSESVGIYDTSSVRGFDLEAAGNYRVNGTYFVRSSGVSSFFLETTTVRIGPNTLGVDLPGPSGVVDYRLRDPAAGEPSLLTAGREEFGQPFTDFLFKHRSSDGRFAGAIGLGLFHDMRNAQGGGGGRSWLVAGTARFSLGPATARVFGGEYDYVRPATFRFTFADPDVRPELARGRFIGQKWAMSRGQRRIAGILVDTSLGNGLALGTTAVFSQEDPTRAYSQLFLGVDADRRARSLIIASPQQRAAALSGEIRLSWAGETGAVSHRATASVRGRRSRSRFGGDRVVDLGIAALDQEAPEASSPDLSDARASLRNAIDQWGVGLAYRLSWANRLTVNAGLLRTDYEKTFIAADGTPSRRAVTLLLHNIGGAVRVLPGLDLYASYSRGLEEAGTAPGSAANRNEVLNAIQVTQRELGMRYALTPGLRLVVAGFETEKPYAGIDSTTNIYRLLGSVRHRGVEASLSGSPTGHLSIIVGGVWLDPELSHDGAATSMRGGRPVAVPRLRGIASLNYSVPAISGLSLDAGLEYVGARPLRAARDADGRQSNVPSSLTANFGLRYRLPVPGWRATLRAQLFNAFDTYGLTVNGAETLDFLAPRRFRVLLTTEF